MYPQDLKIPTVKLRFTRGRDYTPQKTSSPFIKGPVPLDWLSKAAQLPGKAVQVALALFWLFGMSPTVQFKMTRRAMELFCLSTDAYLDGLNRLEKIGLIKVLRRPGQRALVEIVQKSP
jgi:hypothetical protein